MADIRLLAIPIGGRTIASSRLRLYSLVEALSDRFRWTVLPPGQGDELKDQNPKRFDLVYVQKDARAAVVEFCRRAVDAGVPVVYDIDDDFGCWAGMDEAAMCELAAAVTVDSEWRAAAVRGTAGGEVTVLPCMIDAAGDPARRPYQHYPREKITTVGSFGNLVSLRHTLPYLAAVPPECDTFVIGPADAGDELVGPRLVPFDLGTFVVNLTAADVFVLAHGPLEAPLKDNNRLIMAFSLGVATLVSPSPAYLEVLGHTGLEWLACQPAEVAGRLAELADPAYRARIGAAGHEYAWTHYSPTHCAERFADVLDAAVSRTR